MDLSCCFPIAAGHRSLLTLLRLAAKDLLALRETDRALPHGNEVITLKAAGAKRRAGGHQRITWQQSDLCN
jgi:hypothetical protein